MSKYIIQVHKITQSGDLKDTTTISSQEVFKLGVDEFDAFTFCAALRAQKRGRPAKKTKEVSP